MKTLIYTEFIKRAREIHKNEYDYPEQVFENTKTKIKIFCNKGNHYFEQLPSTHLLGKGCRKCSHENTRKSLDVLKKQLFEKFQDRFKYDFTNYTCSTSKIKVICKECNIESEQSAIHHLISKNGCPSCGIKLRNKKITKSFESFKKQSLERNGDIFNIEIDEIPFTRKSKLKVECKLCSNIFSSYANNILNKVGCPACSHNSKHPDTQGFIYQLIYNGEPIPYIGLTTCSLKKRLQRHKEAVLYKKSNTILFNYLKDKDLKLLTIEKLDEGKAFELGEKEDYWIDKLKTKVPLGLNKNKGGSGLNLKYIK